MIKRIGLRVILTLAIVAGHQFYVGNAHAEAEKPNYGYHKVLTTKDCLVFLKENQGEMLSAHLLPKSYARCLHMTRKFLRKQKQDNPENLPSDAQQQAELEAGHKPSENLYKKYYRVQKSED